MVLCRGVIKLPDDRVHIITADDDKLASRNLVQVNERCELVLPLDDALFTTYKFGRGVGEEGWDHKLRKFYTEVGIFCITGIAGIGTVPSAGALCRR